MEVLFFTEIKLEANMQQYDIEHVLKWVKMYILKGNININFLFGFVLKCHTCSTCVYYFLCSDEFCVEKSIWIYQALNFMEQNLSGLF